MNGDKVTIRFVGIEGNLQVKVDLDEEEGITSVYLDGDPKGLLSLARLASQLAELDQRILPSLPDHGASEHIHLESDIDLAKNSCPLILGRLDDKCGEFDDTFIARTKVQTRTIIHRW